LDQLHGLPAIALLAVTFTALILVAADEVRKKKRAKREQREQESRPEALSGPPSFQALSDAAPAATSD
jgi:hypothetical protein